MNTDEFWLSDFGVAYAKRNMNLVENNFYFFQEALCLTTELSSILELGAGTGQNTQALHQLYPEAELWSVEINKTAADHIPVGNVIVGSLFDVTIPKSCELTFTKGVGIHIPPELTNQLYDMLYVNSYRYILMAEYFSPRREMINYRGFQNKLWKANFYKEMMERHPDLELLDYGFVGEWDEYPQDNLNYWLWKK